MQLNGYFLSCKQVANQMKKQRKGVIINLGSIYGTVGPDFSIYKGTNLTMPAAYSAIKGGINAFTRYFATYFGKYGIRANVVCPGGIFDNQPKEFVKNYEQKTPLNRMGVPDDVVGAVIFLASDAASYITGQVLMIDGGWTSW
jgi:NAD(P)-dependent dehydrogenase (short-subunit alcohol dehydrogenase family)